MHLPALPFARAKGVYILVSLPSGGGRDSLRMRCALLAPGSPRFPVAPCPLVSPQEGHAHDTQPCEWLCGSTAPRTVLVPCLVWQSTTSQGLKTRPFVPSRLGARALKPTCGRATSPPGSRGRLSCLVQPLAAPGVPELTAPTPRPLPRLTWPCPCASFSLRLTLRRTPAIGFTTRPGNPGQIPHHRSLNVTAPARSLQSPPHHRLRM